MKKRILSMLLAIVMVVGMLPGFAVTASTVDADVWDGTTASQAWDSGSGAEADPYIIMTAAQLAKLAADVNSGTDYSGTYFKLGADLDLGGSDRIWTPIGDATHTFKGNFNGDGKTISNMYAHGKNTNNKTYGYRALFGNITGGAIENFTLASPSSTGAWGYIAAAVAYGSGATVKNIIITNPNVTTQAKSNKGFAGGVAGHIADGVIENCKIVSGTIDSKFKCTGGVVGYATDAQISGCSVKDVTISSTSQYVGGIVGQLQYTDGNNSIENCTVENCAISSTSSAVGGVVGYAYGNSAGIITVKLCSVTGGSVTASHYAGGIMGQSFYADIIGCCNYGASVTATGSSGYAGGILGYYNIGNCYSCFSSAVITASKNPGGIIGGDQANYYECAYDKTLYTNKNLTYSSTKGFTAEEIEDGAAAYHLANTGTREKNFHNWGQKIGTDLYPVWNTNNDSSIVVYREESSNGYIYFNEGTVDVFEPNEDGYYEISDTETWYKFARKAEEDSSVKGLVTAAIDFSAVSVDDIAEYRIGTEDAFTGIFDGGNKTISGLPETDKPLFGTIGTEGKLLNMTLSGATVTSRYDTAGLVLENNGTVENCTVTNVSVSGSMVGGMIGDNNGTISNCTAENVTVSSTSSSAGLVSYNTGTIKDCAVVSGTIMADSSTKGSTYDAWAGGICGRSVGGSISGCSNGATVIANSDDNHAAAGIVAAPDKDSADQSVQVTKCFNTGAISSDFYAGGITGFYETAAYVSISLCYNTGKIEGTIAGGIAAYGSYNKNDSFINCYNAGQVNGSKAGGIAGSRGNVIIQNCHNYGKVVSTNIGAPIVGVDSGVWPGTGNLINNHAIEGNVEAPTVRSFYDTSTATSSSNAVTVGSTREQFASGEIAYLLQQANGETAVWRQGENYPVFVSDENGKVVKIDFFTVIDDVASNESFATIYANIGEIVTENKYPESPDTKYVVEGYYSNSACTEKIDVDTYEPSEDAGIYVKLSDAHEHIWNYEIATTTTENDTIKVTCIEAECPITEPQFVTITIPSLNVYNGTDSANATLSAETLGDYTNLSASIKYWKGDTELTSAPTDAGTYKASITITVGSTDYTAYVTYTIAQAQVTPPTGLTAVYGQTLADVSLSGFPGWTWVASTVSVGNVGEQTHKANFAGSDNYAAASNVDVTVTVSQSGATMTAQSDKSEYTYGEPVIITVSGITPSGVAAPTRNTFSLNAPTENQVAIWNGDTQLTEPQIVSGSPLTFTVTGLDASDTEYTLTARFTGNDNMAATSAEVTFTVNKAAQDTFSITGQPADDIAYGDTFTLGTTGGTGDGTVTWFATGTASVDASGKVTINGVGAFTVTATKAGGTNYTDATDTYSGTSGKATPNIGDVTYNGGTLYNSTDISTVVLTRSDTTIPGTLELTDSELTAGTKAYNWKFTPEESTYYNTITSTVTLTVTADVLEKIEASGTLTKTAYVYGDTFSLEELTITATYTSGATKDVTANVTFGVLSVGQTTVELTYGGKSCTVSGITVSKKQLDVSGMSWTVPTSEDAVYSGSVKTATLNGTLPDGVTVTKIGDTATNVGSYTAEATFSLEEGYSAENYEIIGTNPLTASWEITVKTVAEADISISGVNASYTYTGSAIEPVVEVVVGGKTLVKDTDYTVSYGANTNASTDGGSVTVTLKGNYIGTKTVPFTILAKEQTAFSISGVSSATYGDPAITLIANGGSGDGAITWSIASGSEFAEISGNGATATLTIKGAGSVVVNAVKAASTDGNYGATGVAVHSIVINKATVTANNFTYTDPTDLVYSKSAKKAGVTGNAAYGAITITYYSDSSLTNVVDPINVGTYYVGITTAGGVNYNRLTKTLIGSFTISAKEIDVTAKAQTRQYNQDNPTLTYEADALYDGDSFTGALATDATKTSDVGEYMITEGTLSAGDNYKIKFTGAKLVITKADGPAALTVTGSYTNDGMTYTYTVDAIEGAEYSKNGTEWQDSNVFSGLSAGHKYTFYARIKETKNVLAGGIGQSAEVDLSKLPGNGTVTIAGWTYGESANAPVVNSTTGNNEVTYLYESTDGKGHSSEAAPTNAGAYKLTVTFATTDTHNGTTASAEFTIAKATPDVTAPTGLNATYGDTLADVELDTGWTWKDAGSTEVGNAGENTFTVIYTKDNSGNYNTVEKTVTINVSPKTVTAAVSVVGDSFIFGGSEQKPGVTVKDGETTIPESEYTVTYKDNTNAGTAAVTVTDKDGGNYTVSGTTTFEISKKASSALSGVEREFMRTIATTGNEIDVAAMLPDNRGTTTYTITSSGYTVLENVSVDENGKLVFDTKTSAAAASDTITVKVLMQNYTDVTLTVSVILNEKTPQNITGVTGAEGLIYNGNTQQGYTGTPASEKYTGSYEITYTGRDNSYNSSVAPTDAGEYTVTFKIPDTDLYYSGNVSVNFTIGKAQATVTADDKEAYVGKRMPELTYKVSGLIGSDTINVELSCDANMNRTGETPIVVTATDPNGNYEITTVNGTLTVKIIYLPIIPSNPTYPPVVDGDDNGDVTVTPKNPEKGDTVTITPDPDAGYEVDEIVVSDKNGNLVEVINNRDGTYSFKQPNGKVNIEVTFKEIIKVCPGDKTCPMYGYTDLDMNVWYHDGVHFCIENKLMNGTSTTTFAPGATTSRAMIVTILWRLAGEPIVNYAMSFDDVASDTWYTEAIRWAASEGIVNGYSDTAFGPNDNITREQLATILYRYEQKNGGGFKGMWMFRMDYVDLAEVSDWAYEAMCWMNMNSIVNGKPGKVLDPKGNATRAEAATMLYRYCDIIGKDEKN